MSTSTEKCPIPSDLLNATYAVATTVDSLPVRKALDILAENAAAILVTEFGASSPQFENSLRTFAAAIERRAQAMAKLPGGSRTTLITQAWRS